MNIALFGGTGNAGKYVLKELLKRNHKIKVLVRDPKKLNFSVLPNITNLEIIQGNILDEEKVKKTIFQTEAVIITIGRQRKSPNNLQTEAIKIIHNVMNLFMIKRILILTGAGIYTSQDNPQLIDHVLKILISLIDPLRIKDAQHMVNFLTKTKLDWTIVRTHLHHSSESKQFNIGLLGDKNIKLFCSRKNIAKFIKDSVEGNLYIKKSPVISD